MIKSYFIDTSTSMLLPFLRFNEFLESFLLKMDILLEMVCMWCVSYEGIYRNFITFSIFMFGTTLGCPSRFCWIIDIGGVDRGAKRIFNVPFIEFLANFWWNSSSSWWLLATEKYKMIPNLYKTSIRIF